jgi:hypothetical protein
MRIPKLQRQCRLQLIQKALILNFGHSYLPFDLAQGGESFDFAQDREPVERLVEPFGVCILVLGIFMIFISE